MVSNIREYWPLTLRYPHKIDTKTDQNQQLNKKRLHAAVKACLCTVGTSSSFNQHDLNALRLFWPRENKMTEAIS